MQTRRFDLRTFLLIVGAAAAGAAWAIYNRGLTKAPFGEEEFRPLVWVIFAVPFAMFLGWLAARWRERWLAAFVSFCVYFFSPFIAARYESCTVVNGSFSLVSCFTQTAEAQTAANAAGHTIYFQAIVVVHLLAALVIALQRALVHSTIPVKASPPIEARSQESEAGS